VNLETSFHERYASLSDAELLHIAGDRRDLLEEAAVALDAEMTRRGLTHKQARARKRENLRLDIEELRAHRRKLSQSKYLAAQMNLRAFFIGLAAPLVAVLIFGRHHLPEEWAWPLFVVYLGALIACSAVQPWVRHTLSFWFSLVVSSVPEFVVARWLAVYHPTNSSSGAKGALFLCLLAGYLLGGALFLLLQRLEPSPETKATD
jgi:hypothetical protein